MTHSRRQRRPMALVRTGCAALALAAVACSAHRPAPAARAPAAAVASVNVRRPAAALPESTPPAAEKPRGYVEMSPVGVAPTSQGNALVLVDSERRVALPIMIGGTEGLSIELRLQKRHFSRPLTQDLLDELVRRLGGHFTSVRIDSIQNDVFHATVVVWARGRSFEVDSRASDAVAVAIGDRVPVYVARSVLEQAGIALSGLEVKPPAALHPTLPQI